MKMLFAFLCLLITMSSAQTDVGRLQRRELQDGQADDTCPTVATIKSICYDRIQDPFVEKDGYIIVPEDAGNNRDGEIDYLIQCESELNIQLEVEVIALTGGDDSLYIQWNKGGESTWFIGAFGSVDEDGNPNQWVWRTVGDTAAKVNTVKFATNQGENTLTLHTREDGLMFQALRIKGSDAQSVCKFKRPAECCTKGPTAVPTNTPSTSPSTDPSKHPSMSPTQGPTSDPSMNPTKGPTSAPSMNPTQGPTSSPSMNPTKNPVDETLSPTANPTTSTTTTTKGMSSAHGDPIIRTFKDECYNLNKDGFYLASAHPRYNHKLYIAIYNDYIREIQIRDNEDEILYSVSNMNEVSGGWNHRLEYRNRICNEFSWKECEFSHHQYSFDAQIYRITVQILMHDYLDPALEEGQRGVHLDIYPIIYRKRLKDFVPDEYTGVYFDNPYPEELEFCPATTSGQHYP